MEIIKNIVKRKEFKINVLEFKRFDDSING